GVYGAMGQAHPASTPVSARAAGATGQGQLCRRTCVTGGAASALESAGSKGGAAAEALSRRAGRQAARTGALRGSATAAEAGAGVSGGHARAAALLRAIREEVSGATGHRQRRTWQGETAGRGEDKDEDGQAQQISGHNVSFQGVLHTEAGSY